MSSNGIHITSHPLRLPHNSPETLLRNLRCRRLNRSLRIRVLESTSVLPVLKLCRLGGANAYTGGIGAACRAAVGISDAAARDELGAIAGTDGAGAGYVGGDLRRGEGRDC